MSAPKGTPEPTTSKSQECKVLRDGMKLASPLLAKGLQRSSRN